MMEKTLLEDIFNTSEEEVETFMDAIKDKVGVPDGYDDIANAKPAQVKQPELTDQISGSVRIQHGYHDTDYVWHISCDPRKGWRVSDERICYAVAKLMNDVIPQTIRVNFFLPLADWDLKEYTFKAINLSECWSVDAKAITELNIKLLDTLNTLV